MACAFGLAACKKSQTPGDNTGTGTPAPKMTEQEWQTCLTAFVAAKNYALTQSIGGNVVGAMKLDGTTYYDVVDGAERIFTKDGENYYVYRRSNAAADWAKTSISAAVYDGAVNESACNMVTGVATALGAAYSSFTYADNNYTAQTLTITQDLTLKDVCITVKSNALAKVVCTLAGDEADVLITIDGIGATQITVPVITQSLQYTSFGSYYEVTGIGTVTGTDIVIPATYNGLPVTSIGSDAFEDCTDLTSISIPDSVTSVGYHAFSDCRNLPYLVYEGAKYLGNSTNPYLVLLEAENTNITACKVHDNTKVIASNAFSGCRYLGSVTIPDSVTSINKSAFYGCSSLQYNQYSKEYSNQADKYLGNSTNPYVALIEADIYYYVRTLHENTKVIAGDAFSGCRYLENITIPAGVTGIAYGAFTDCELLKSITVTEGNANYHSAGNCLIETGSKALLAGCGNSVIPADGSVTSIARSAFHARGLSSIEIPAGITYIDSSAFSECNVTSITVTEGNANYHSTDNCLIDTAGKTLILGCRNSVIPADGSVTGIGSGAFTQCTALESITIPASVTSIGDEAFKQCYNLSSVTISAGVISIGKDAFDECIGLVSITIPDSVTSIGSGAFSNCNRLASIVIGSGVTHINDYAFYSCQALRRAYYCGTQADWDDITIGDYYNNRLTESVYFYSENEPADDGKYWHYDTDGVTPVEWATGN